MNPTRSTAFLLSFAAAAAAALGQEAGQPARDALAGAWSEAMTLARRHKAPMLVFVLPEAAATADAKAVAATREAEKRAGMLVSRGDSSPPMRTARDLMLRQVQLLRGSQNPTRSHPPDASDAQMVFVLAVPVFATRASCGARPGENVLLLAPDGKRMRGFTLDLLDHAGFVDKVGGELFAAEALAPRQANVPPAILQAISQLRAARQVEPADTEAAIEAQRRIAELTEQLSKHVVAAGPALVRRAEDKVVAEQDLWALESARAPLGSEAHMELGDPCPGCGMGYTPPGLLTVLKLIGP